MPRIHLVLKNNLDQSYDIEIERGLFRKIASDLRMKRFADKYVVITDKKVNRVLGKKMELALKREKLWFGKVVVEAGELSKALASVQTIVEKMLELGVDRKTGVIALGGGMVGDLAGFAAAVFMRGIPYVHVPTTLLAMVDSSIGGKTGVNVPSAKNMIGAFWQPKKVYSDPEILQSLPKNQWKSGLAEAIKSAAIKDRDFWDFLEKHAEVFQKDLKRLLPSEWKMVEDMISRCVAIKAEVVMKDEKEGNLRQILNYGHTFGHVIEHMSGYTVLHGEAVATGMRLASRVSVKLRHMTVQEFSKFESLLDTFEIGRIKTKGLITEFVQHMKKDKKGGLKLVLVDRIGRCYQQLGNFSIKVDEKIVKEVLKESGLIDDQENAREALDARYAREEVAVQQSSWVMPPPSSYSSYSNPLNPDEAETLLQRKLREMKEKREHAQRTGGKWLPG